MAQTWHHLLFAHWPVPASTLLPHLHKGLQVDTYEGQAWIGVVVFSLSGIRLRGLPPMPLVSAFPEINVRTYVTAEGRPGVLFLTMDADNRLGIALAKRWYHLPYYRAHIHFSREQGQVTCASRRVERNSDPARWAARYGPTTAPCAAPSGSLVHWLTERYCMYAADRQGRLYAGAIHHAPWPLQEAQVTLGLNTLTEGLGIPLPPTPPLLHYARRMDARFWWPQRVRPTVPARRGPVPGPIVV